jgi:hypothetical protein
VPALVPVAPQLCRGTRTQMYYVRALSDQFESKRLSTCAAQKTTAGHKDRLLR